MPHTGHSPRTSRGLRAEKERPFTLKAAAIRTDHRLMLEEAARTDATPPWRSFRRCRAARNVRSTILLGALLAGAHVRSPLEDWPPSLWSNHRRAGIGIAAAISSAVTSNGPCSALPERDLNSLPGPHTRAKSRRLAVGGQNRARRGLSAGGRWIRTIGTAAQKPWICAAFRALRVIGGAPKRYHLIVQPFSSARRAIPSSRAGARF